MKRTISAMSGKGSINHNRRIFTAENVDPTRSHLNVEYCYTPIEQAYDQLFGEALAAYNAKQKRKEAEEKVYLLLNKPRGYVTTLSDEKGRKNVAELVKDCGVRVYPVGRLDLDSEGLLLMTNDGDFMQHLLHPSGEINKIYHVSVFGPVGKAAEKLSAITDLDGEKIRPAQVKVLKQSAQTAELEITIHEGKNRQIRRMCAACDLTVKRLRRVQEHSLVLGDLPVGQWRYLTEQEVTALKEE